MGLFSGLFSNESKEFDYVKIDQEVIDSVIYYSKRAYPNEFLAFFDGFVKDKTLYITSLIFLPGDTCETGATVRTDLLPITTKQWGSVHSHPGPSASPSDADLLTFSKNGVFHMIVCLPYSVETFKAYDKYGNSFDYTIGDYSEIIQEETLGDFFDEDDIVKEDEVVKAGFFDYEEVIVDDENKIDRYSEFEKRHQQRAPRIQINNKDNISFTVVTDENGKLIIKPFKNE